MKFFTPDLLNRFGSDDANIASQAHDELERRSEAHLRHLRDIQDKLPQRLRALFEQFYLHDSRVNFHSPFAPPEPGKQGDTTPSDLDSDANRSAQEGRRPSFWIHLQLDTAPKEILVLQYRSALVEEVQRTQQPGDDDCPYLEWLHDELDLVPTGKDNEFRHSILFTKGLELHLKFKDFDFATLRPIEIAPEFAEA